MCKSIYLYTSQSYSITETIQIMWRVFFWQFQLSFSYLPLTKPSISFHYLDSLVRVESLFHFLNRNRAEKVALPTFRNLSDQDKLKRLYFSFYMFFRHVRKFYLYLPEIFICLCNIYFLSINIGIWNNHYQQRQILGANCLFPYYCTYSISILCYCFAKKKCKTNL